MRNQSHKTNQFLQFLLKIIVVSAAIFFIGYKITSDEELSFPAFLSTLQRHRVFSPQNIGVLLLLSFLNWFFEVKKWQHLSRSIRENTLRKATRESLASFTAAIFTPSRIGEYGAKSLYYSKPSRRKIIFLNFVGNFTQLLVTVIFGIFGLLYLLFELQLPFTLINFLWVTAIILAPFAGYRFIKRRNWKIRGRSIESLEKAFHEVPGKIKGMTLLFATLRYLIFTHQFYFFLLVFKVDLPYLLVISAVASIYFLSSVIPTMMIFDAVIKGGFAVWIFAFLGVQEMRVLVIILALWILNFGLPALMGSFYVLRYKPPEKPVSP